MSPRGEPVHGILTDTIDPHFQVQMRPCGVACTPHIGDGLSPIHLLSGTHRQAAGVGIQGRISAAMVDHHIVSIAVIPARFDNLSAIRRYNWRAINAFAVRPVDVNRFVVTAISCLLYTSPSPRD